MHPSVSLVELVESGNLLQLKTIASNELRPYLTKVAARAGYGEILRYLLEEAEVRASRLAMYEAARRGDLKMLELLYRSPVMEEPELLFVKKSNPIDAAARGGHFYPLLFLLNRGYEGTPYSVKQAIKGGCGDCLRLLLNRGLPLPPRICHIAAQYGNVEGLRICWQAGAPWDHFISSVAAKYGQLEILKYYRANSPVNFAYGALFLTAFYDHPACLEFLCQQEAPRSSKVEERITPTSHPRSYDLLVRYGYLPLPSTSPSPSRITYVEAD